MQHKEKLNQDEIQEIVYRISHDLAAPLRHANSFSELLSIDYEDQLSGEAKQWLGHIRASTEKAQSMLTGLLVYSRLSTNQQAVEKFCLQDAWDIALEQHATLVQQQQAEIEILQPLPDVCAVKEHWVTLFSVLLNNSLLYQPENQQPQVKLHSRQLSQERFILEFHDNGIGVDEKYYDEITTIFKRLHMDNEYPGIGIGLSLCQRILQFYGGDINFNRSELGGLNVQCTFYT